MTERPHPDDSPTKPAPNEPNTRGMVLSALTPILVALAIVLVALVVVAVQQRWLAMPTPDIDPSL